MAGRRTVADTSAHLSIVSISPSDARAQLRTMADEIGPKAAIYVHLSTDLYGKPLSASIDRNGVGGGCDFRCEGDSLDGMVAALRAGWAKFAEEHALRVTRSMALE